MLIYLILTQTATLEGHYNPILQMSKTEAHLAQGHQLKWTKSEFESKSVWSTLLYPSVYFHSQFFFLCKCNVLNLKSSKVLLCLSSWEIFFFSWECLVFCLVTNASTLGHLCQLFCIFQPFLKDAVTWLNAVPKCRQDVNICSLTFI